MIVPLAHAGHWLVSAAYFLPVVAFLVWLAAVSLRDRIKQDRRDGSDDNS